MISALHCVTLDGHILIYRWVFVVDVTRGKGVDLSMTVFMVI